MEKHPDYAGINWEHPFPKTKDLTHEQTEKLFHEFWEHYL